jgi:hypothetical protein
MAEASRRRPADSGDVLAAFESRVDVVGGVKRYVREGGT